METLATNLVKDKGNIVVGAAVAFRPYYYPQKGRWYEPYARQHGDSISVEQIGSAAHDYFQTEFFQACMRGDTLKWGTPYMDYQGAHSEVTTYAQPLCDAGGQPVAVLAVDVTTTRISEVVADLRHHNTSFTMVLAADGTMIATPADSLCPRALATKIAAMIFDPAVEKQDKANGRVTSFPFRDEARGRSAHVYYARKKFAPHWLMVSVVYDDEAFGELEQMQSTIMWLSLAALVVLALIIQLFARNGRRLHATLMQQRADRELQIAAGIQQALLPQDEPTLHGVGSVAVKGCQLPAREVGGDLYNVFVRDGKLFFCIGDASGKGVPAAIIMAMTQTLFHNIASQENNPATIMQRLNTSTCHNNSTNMFVTLFIGVLDLHTGRLTY